MSVLGEELRVLRDQVLLSTGSGPSCVSFVDPDKDKPSPSSGLEPDSELGRSLPAQGQNIEVSQSRRRTLLGPSTG